MLLEGLHIPLTTPFHPDGRLNPRKLAANVVRYSKTPAAGFIVLGPSGEPTLLSDDETREVLRTAAEAAAPEKVLIAGISRDSVSATLAFANFAAENNYDAILVGVPTSLGNALPMPPKGSKIDILQQAQQSRLEQLAFFQAIADRSPLPLVLLSNSIQSVTIPNSVTLASHPNVIGIIDIGAAEIRQRRIRELSEGTASIKRAVKVTHTFAALTARMELAAKSGHTPALVSASSLTGTATAVAEPSLTVRTRTRSIGFQILSGNSSSLLDALNSGAVGIAPPFAACAPQACYEVFAAWKDQDQPLAQEKQARLFEAAALAEALSSRGLKFACDLNGYFGGLPRLPHLPPTGAERTELEQLMKPLRN
jgi:4-hydroxy-2-oxoglutarate aldolase